jgi:hypothetical protein
MTIISKVLNILTRQSFLNAVVHALGSKGFGGMGQGLGSIFYRLSFL